MKLLGNMNTDKKNDCNKSSKAEIVGLLDSMIFDLTNDPFEVRLRRDGRESIIGIYVEGGNSKAVREKIPPKFHGFTTIVYNVPSEFIHEKFYRGRE